MRSPRAMRQREMRRTKAIAVANQKGGVGKTTTVINLGASLAVNDLEVLVVDLDPQANATSGLGVDEAACEVNIHTLLSEPAAATAEESIMRTSMEGLWIVPGTRDMAGLEIELAGLSEREYYFSRAIRHFRGRFDYVLIDCPPSLGLLTINALVAADQVLLPLQSEYYALEGLSHLLDTIGRVRSLWNPSLSIHGILLTMYDRRLNLSQEVAADARAHLGDLLYSTRIPRNVRLSEAPSYGKPALLYAVDSTGAVSYLDLAREVMSR